MNSEAKTKTQVSDDWPLCPVPWGTECGQGLRQHSLRNCQGVLAVQTQPLQSERRPRARRHPHRGCSRGWAGLGHPPQSQDVPEPPRLGHRGGAAVPDAPLPVAPRRGVGCIHYEMATGRPLFPGSTVKEELHLIFRLLGQSPALPQCDHQGATELCPAQAHKGPGKSRCACSQQGEDPVDLAIFCLLPFIAPLQVALSLAPHHASHPFFCLPRDPYRRDVARSDGPV